jgi:D-alanine-D-alanine ligase
MKKMTVGIVHNRPIPTGEPNWESSADVLVQVEAIEASLAEMGHRPVRIPFGRDLADFVEQIRKENAACVFNLCESVDDDPLFIGHPAAVLELLGVPFTGSSSLALALSTDKFIVKRLLQASSILTPGFFLYQGGELLKPPELTYPVILKPRCQDASIGIDQESIAVHAKQLLLKLPEFHARYGPLLVEEYLSGREFNISLVGYPSPKVMPLAEIDFSSLPVDLYPIVGYRAKWDTDSPEYQQTKRLFPHDLSTHLQRTMRRTARECFQLFGLRDYGRVDMRLDERGRLHVLEVNANPCLSPDAGFAAAVAKEGLGYTDMIRALLEFAEMRIKL